MTSAGISQEDPPTCSHYVGCRSNYKTIFFNGNFIYDFYLAWKCKSTVCLRWELLLSLFALRNCIGSIIPAICVIARCRMLGEDSSQQ